MTDIEQTQEMRIFRVEDPNCEKTFSIAVPETEYKAWQDGMILQDAMPSLGDAERNLLISGTCPDCWALQMNPDNEDEPCHLYNPNCDSECCEH